MLLITYIFVLLVFILFSFALYKLVKLYLDFRAKGQEQKHYPITLGITLLSIPLISKAFAIPSYLMKVFNKYTSSDLPIPKDDWKSMVFYGLYVFAVIVIIYIYYKSPSREKERPFSESGLEEIDYPDNSNIVVSPHLHERIQELFELKHMELKFLYDTKEKLLVGHYFEGIHGYRYFIYCDSTLKNVSKVKQDEVFQRLQELSSDFAIDGGKYYQPTYFFFIEEGVFEENDNTQLKCYTEDTYLKEAINFSHYLKKNIERFDTNPIDIGGISLKESFIEPSFNKGETDLKNYLDTWLDEKSLRHISLLSDYGMGKTSFLKYYTKYLSQKILNGESFSRYPVFISLTNTSPMSNDGIETKIESFVSRELGVNYALFERLVHLGKIVFVLDGFDEMGFIGTGKTRREQFNSIWQLATKNNKILISGRPSYLPTDFERKNVLNIVEESLAGVQQVPFTEVVELDYFVLEQIEQTVNIYYEGNNVEKYMNYIKRNRSILDLCKRPSMLHMTMSILPKLYSENSTRIITSSDIMNKYTEYWISRQESKAITGYFSKNDNRKKEFIINFFTELSGEMFKDETLIISKKVLDEVIEKELKKAMIDIESNEAMFEGFRNELYTGYFIEVDITNVKDNHFKFVHKSIFEFFVSKKIIKLIEEKKFNDTLMSMDWNRGVMAFIDDSIEHDKYQNSKYPSLIMLRDSWIDKIFFIPFTKILKRDHRFFIGLIIVSMCTFGGAEYISHFDIWLIVKIILYFMVFISSLFLIIFLDKFSKKFLRRYLFIEKAYYLDFIRHNGKITDKQLKHFFDFSSYFKNLKDIKLDNYVFKKLNLNIRFENSQIKNIIFDSCLVSRLKFTNCALENIDLRGSEVYQLYFEHCTLINIQLGEGQSNISRTRFRHISYELDKEKKEYYELVFRGMDQNSLDEISFLEIKKFINKNDIKEEYIYCSSSDLKNKFFSKENK